MIACDRAGTFRGTIVEYGLQEAESGSVGINMRVLLSEMWNHDSQEWFPWSDYQMEAEGTTWIIKKDGNVNDKATESLMRYAGWDGSFVSITEKTWHPTPMACEVKPDEYKGVTRFRVEFINDFNRTPGAVSNCDTSKAKALQARYGAPLRALQANVSRNKPRRDGNPLPLPPAPPAPPAMAGAGAKGNGDQIPF